MGEKEQEPTWRVEDCRGNVLDVLAKPRITWSDSEYQGVFDNGCSHNVQSVIMGLADYLGWVWGVTYQNMLIAQRLLVAVLQCASDGTAEIHPPNPPA